MSGKFVTIEGCEGVGKSTLTAGLKRYFEQNGIDAVFTREPGGTPVAEKIRGLILDANNDETAPMTELLLYAAARAQHTEEMIIPAVNAGKIVVCDRYSDSTLAYQHYARGLSESVCRELNRIAECGVKIDLTVFLDLTPEKGFSRKGGADKTDRLENAGAAFHRRVYEGFKAIEKREPERFVAVDADKTAEEVLESVIALMKAKGVINK